MASDDFSLEDALEVTRRWLDADRDYLNHVADLKGAEVSEHFTTTEYLLALAQYRVPYLRSTFNTRFGVGSMFLGGAVARGTWGRPFYEYDLFVVLEDRQYLASSPTVILKDIADTLRHRHNFARDKQGRILVAEGEWEGHGRTRPASIVIVPAFVAERGLIIPDRWRDAWICVDPHHMERLGKAADAVDPSWRELAKVVKAWNNREAKFDPFIRPGLLLEVMVLESVRSLATFDFGTQLVGLFQSLYQRIDEEWPDPAGLAPPLTSYMTRNRRAFARQHLKHAWMTLGAAKREDNSGNCAEAKRLARSILGPMLPLSEPEEPFWGHPINNFASAN
jgi:hypothetical protein